jgi:tRNA-dihydrouridine synthase
VSVKTRIGYNKNEIETWIPALLETGLSALTIHARTRKEMSSVPARWEHVREAVSIRNQMGADTLIIGNGDIINIKEAKEKIREFGADGAMLGRAIFGNPFLFKERIGRENKISKQNIKRSLLTLVEHTKLFEKLLGKNKNFATMKKHFKAYVSGFDGARELRTILMSAENPGEVEKTIFDYLKNL